MNVGTTYRTVIDQHFLWAPDSAVSGSKPVTRLHWDNVRQVKAGDIIFCWYDQRISFLAVATADSFRAARPQTSSFNEWESIGYRVDVNIIEFDRKVHRDEISAEFIRRFDTRTRPSVFNSKATLNQIYMAHLPQDAALFLLETVQQSGLFEQTLIDAAEAAPKKLPATTRTALVQARIGQGKFRADLIQRWQGKCALTGLKNVDLMVASHIDAWALCDNVARLDPDNGLLLAPHIDRLFDRGLISFSNSGALQVSEQLDSEDRRIFSLDRFTHIYALTEGNQQYLAKHRTRFNFN
ncbi:HNH endonuclease [Oxalobacteraceae bacterium A2-2]